MYLKLCALALMSGLGGCAAATVWTKPGATPAIAASASAQCKATATLQVPVEEVTKQVTSAAIVPNAVLGPQFIAPTYATDDANENARDTVFKGCMYADGWQAQ
jgi:hypothetical protein